MVISLKTYASIFAHKASKNELKIKLSTVTLSALLVVDIVPA